MNATAVCISLSALISWWATKNLMHARLAITFFGACSLQVRINLLQHASTTLLCVAREPLVARRGGLCGQTSCSNSTLEPLNNTAGGNLMFYTIARRLTAVQLNSATLGLARILTCCPGCCLPVGSVPRDDGVLYISQGMFLVVPVKQNASSAKNIRTHDPIGHNHNVL